MPMCSINLSRSLLFPLPLLLALSLTACGGDSSPMTQAPQTAPAIAVVPQSNFNKNGHVDTNKVQAAQTNYQANLGVTK